MANTVKMPLAIIATLCIYCCLLSCSRSQGTEAPLARQGIIDVAGWNFDKQGLVSLNGEYEFYWQKLLDPKDTLSYAETAQPGFAELPGIWNDHKQNGVQSSRARIRNVSAKGYWYSSRSDARIARQGHGNCL